METISQKFILSDLYQLAYRAYCWTSFSPDERAKQTVQGYSTELEADLNTIPEESKEYYKGKYKLMISSWLHAHSRCASSAITGPAKFPVERMKKYNNWEQAKYKDFRDWREKALKGIERSILAARSPEEVSNETWKAIEKGILGSAGIIIEIDKGLCRGTSRPLIVANLVGRIETIAKNGDTVNTLKALELIKKLNTIGPKPVITAKNKIWKLAERAEVAREKEADKAAQENKEYNFEGGKVIFNYAMDRIQIKHDSKPDSSVIGTLKKSAFKWSPTQGVWQRQLTNNAIYYTQQITNLKF